VFQPGSLPLVLIGASAIEKFYEERNNGAIAENEFSHVTTIALQLPSVDYPIYDNEASFVAFSEMIVKHIFETRGTIVFL
jgi:hypothetical protein